MAPRNLHVAVIGAGIAGMQFTRDLSRRGISHTVYERGSEVGGTWRENNYPGLFIDVPISLYQLSFAKKYDWSHAFPRGSEIQDYLVKASYDHDLRRYIRFNTEVLEIAWIDDRWQLTLSDGTTEVADAVVSATGFLDKPSMPRLPGMESFGGPSFHSSNWPADLPVAGQRVGIIGTGSSGIQLTSTLPYLGSEVTQFVRSPQWVEMITNPPAPRWLKLLGRHLAPRSRRVAGFVLRRLLSGPALDSRLWKTWGWRIAPGPDRVAAQQALRDDILYIRDAKLRARMTPSFEPGCKRIPKSDRYFEAIQEPNVKVVVGAIDHIEPRGLVTADGTLHELDVIVYATGYDSHAYMRPMKVTGLHGKTIDEAWADGPYAYRCVSVPGFPNFWVINGPFAPVANISPLICVVDQSDYICRLLQLSAERGVGTAPTPAAAERFVAAIDEAMPNTIWAGDCDSWYRSGSRVILWPWDEAAYHAMFAPLGLDDLELIPVSVAVS
jgi:cation diffusion facilitator CzcD-associated flavoprotein CzcO